MTAKPHKLVGLKAGLIYTDSHLTSCAVRGTFLAVGWFPANDFTIYAGLGPDLQPERWREAIALGAGGTMSDKVGSDLVLAAGYFVIDNPKRNIYMGPELVWITNIRPMSFADVSVVEAAWAIRYGIPHTPIAIGTDLGVTVTTAYGVKGPMISTAPFGLHIVFMRVQLTPRRSSTSRPVHVSVTRTVLVSTTASPDRQRVSDCGNVSRGGRP